MKSVTRLTIVALALTLTLVACGDEASAPPQSGSTILTDETGLDFTTGQLENPGNFANTDLFATKLGESGMRLATGGDSPTHNRPIVWFRNAGMVLETYASLSEVPTDRPTGVDFLTNAKTGYGFVLQSVDGDYIRGWISNATATSVSIEWDRLID
ncbi:MAG TPA: hypothetical protein PK095_17255 [Myxococcota bacterium]|nr:hypothetical protein [Myxococcota bacterium]